MTMPTLAEIERRCAVVGRRLPGVAGDEIGLLRMARALNAVRLNLEVAVLQEARATGWTDEVVRAAALVNGAEQHLRRALLDSFSLTRDDIEESVELAFGQSLDALELLQRREQAATRSRPDESAC